jgi:hypothetical protein
MFSDDKGKYHKVLALEQDQIRKIKSAESFRLGYEIDWQTAENIWNFQHRFAWIQQLRESGEYFKLTN